MKPSAFIGAAMFLVMNAPAFGQTIEDLARAAEAARNAPSRAGTKMVEVPPPASGDFSIVASIDEKRGNEPMDITLNRDEIPDLDVNSAPDSLRETQDEASLDREKLIEDRLTKEPALQDLTGTTPASPDEQ